MYHAGQGVPRDDARATELLRRAAEQDSGARGRAARGRVRRRLGGRRRTTRRRSASSASPPLWAIRTAGSAWGRCTRMAAASRSDGQEAAVWYTLAANAGRPEAQRRMGDAAHLAQLGQRRDDAAAVRWYRLAAEQDPGAAWRLGTMAEAGEGMAQDDAEALKWYQMAAAHGSAGCAAAAGARRRATARSARRGSGGSGEAVPSGRRVRPVAGAGGPRGDAGSRRRRSERRRCACYREAAEHGVPEACDRLGRAYRDGDLGLTVDDAEARHWFKRAADLGDAGGALEPGRDADARPRRAGRRGGRAGAVPAGGGARQSPRPRPTSPASTGSARRACRRIGPRRCGIT